MTKSAFAQIKKLNRTAARKDREAYIFLSLFLIILCFFIVLVSLSHIDQVKARLVFNRFSEILQQNKGLRILRDELENFTGFRVAKLRTLQDIKSEWDAEVPLLDTDLDSDNLIFEVNVPYYELLSQDNVSLRRDREDILRRIANLMLVIGSNDEQVYIDISYFGPFLKSNRPGRQRLPYSDSLLGMGTIARFVENESVPTHALSIHHVIVDQIPILRLNFRIDKIVPQPLIIPNTYSLRSPSLQ